MFRGRVASIDGAETVIVDGVEDLGVGEMPTPREVLVVDLIGERFSGQLVRAEGHLRLFRTENERRPVLLLRDRSGGIPVDLPSSLLVQPELNQRLAAGGHVVITGIASQDDEEAPFDADYELVPRSLDDLEFVPTPPWRAITSAVVTIVITLTVLYLWHRRSSAEARAREMAELVQQLEEAQHRLEKRSDELETLAFQDPLTGVANRRMLRVAAEKAMARALRDGEIVGLLYMDLVRFKRINDSLGHWAGDDVLRDVVKRFQQHVRATDTLARVGGNEFALLLTGLKRPANARHPAKALRDALREPFVVGGQAFFLELRIGLAIFPHSATIVDELITAADLAMDHSDRFESGIGTCDAIEIRDHQEHLRIENRLRLALEHEDVFVLEFKPIFALDGKRPVAAEALIRWQQDDGTIWMPGRFLPIAERTGLISLLDRIVIRKAVSQLREWKAAGPASVAVNVSAASVGDRHLVQFVSQCLTEAGVPGDRLTIEITETASMRDPERARDMLQQMKGARRTHRH